MNNLPDGWAETTIGDICTLTNGKAFKPSEWGNSGLPIVRIQNLNKPASTFNYFLGEVEEKFLINSGELLFAWSGTPGTSFGAHIWAGKRAVLNQHIFKVQFDATAIDRRFLKYAINQTLEEQISKAHGGVGLRHVTKGKFANTRIVLPPLAEQRRIVAKLDWLLARTARARVDLNRISALILLHKQSILAAAFSDELKSREDGVRSAKWNRRTLGEIADEGPNNGWSPKSGRSATGALSLKLTATTSGQLRLDDAAVKRIFDTPPKGSKFWLRPGDLLIQRGNALEHVGASAIFEGPEDTYIYPDLMMRIRINDPNLRTYVWYFLNSREARTYFRKNATGIAGNMPKINGSVVRSLEVPIPDSNTLKSIVQSTKKLIAANQRLAAEHIQAAALLPKLDSAILAMAYRGALVSQDSKDEPASALLTRIRDARAVAPKVKRGSAKIDAQSKSKVEEGYSMALTRDDVSPYYLSKLLRENSGNMGPENLWRVSDMDIAEFYLQLRIELRNGTLRQKPNRTLEAA